MTSASSRIALQATLGGENAHLVDGKAVGDIFVNVSIMLGKATLRVHQLLKLGRGAVVELERKLDEPVEIFANEVLVAKGDVIVTDENKIAVTLTEMVNKYE
ncbi:MAG: flagellar motor switch protein FliN [Alphaproteobacteria bacterium]|nr:flagellar motor switch protein FliN [Alphaproteobacteria bacterium]